MTLLSDQQASIGAAYSFIVLVIALVVQPFIWVVLSPLFQDLNAFAITFFTDFEMYPIAVQNAAHMTFQYLEKAGIVALLFTVGHYLKEYLQPWTMEW